MKNRGGHFAPAQVVTLNRPGVVSLTGISNELSNFGFKGCLRKKAITTIPGSKLEINVFEGFFDYLSALTYFSKDKLTGTTIILNTLTLLDSGYSGSFCASVFGVVCATGFGSNCAT